MVRCGFCGSYLRRIRHTEDTWECSNIPCGTVVQHCEQKKKIVNTVQQQLGVSDEM